jgi:hypothetical protein
MSTIDDQLLTQLTAIELANLAPAFGGDARDALAIAKLYVDEQNVKTNVSPTCETKYLCNPRNYRNSRGIYVPEIEPSDETNALVCCLSAVQDHRDDILGRMGIDGCSEMMSTELGGEPHIVIPLRLFWLIRLILAVARSRHDLETADFQAKMAPLVGVIAGGVQAQNKAIIRELLADPEFQVLLGISVKNALVALKK